MTTQEQAWQIFQRAIERGELVPATSCEECDATPYRLDGAHFTYEEPLRVRWLCRSCHIKWDIAGHDDRPPARRRQLLFARRQRVTFALLPDLHDQVYALAHADRRTVSSMLEMLIEEALDARQARSDIMTSSAESAA